MSRLAYNWGIDQWERLTSEGKNRSAFELNRLYNSIKDEQFPFGKDVSKNVHEYAFRHLHRAYLNFFHSLKTGDGKYGKPQKKKKRDRFGSYTIPGAKGQLSFINMNSRALQEQPHNIEHKHQYLRIPKLGTWVKMMEPLRFNGKIISITIMQHADKFYAVFCVDISQEEYNRTHRPAIEDGNLGIDLGVHTLVALSNGVLVENPLVLEKVQKRVARLQSKSESRQHPQSRRQAKNGILKSRNYIKACRLYSKLHRRAWSMRDDFDQKLTTCLVRHFSVIALETLDIAAMQKDNQGKNKRKGHAQARDAAWYTIKTLIKNKAKRMGRKTVEVPKFERTSSICSQCGVKVDGLTVRHRIFRCPQCGFIANRDYNAAMNIKKYIGMDSSEVFEPKPADCDALLSDLAKNRIVTSQVEPGRRYTIKSDKSSVSALLV